jgi:hypothetical protein
MTEMAIEIEMDTEIKILIETETIKTEILIEIIETLEIRTVIEIKTIEVIKIETKKEALIHHGERMTILRWKIEIIRKVDLMTMIKNISFKLFLI